MTNTSIFPEPVRSEMFELFRRSTSLLGALGEGREDHFASKLELLIAKGWLARMEFSFDRAGLLPSTLKIEPPGGGESVEVCRMEAVACAPFPSETESTQSKILDAALTLASLVIEVASAQINLRKINMDELLLTALLARSDLLSARSG